MMPRVTARLAFAFSLPLLIQLCACAARSEQITQVRREVPPKEQVLLRLVGFGPAPAMPPEASAALSVNAESIKSAESRDAESAYELCFAPRAKSPLPYLDSELKSVRLASGAPGAAAVESTLRAWKWTIYGSRPVSQLRAESFCFHERLPFADAAQQMPTPDAARSEPRPFDKSKNYDELLVNELVENGSYELALLPAILETQRKPKQPSDSEAAKAPILIRKKPIHTPAPHLPDELKARYLNDLVLGAFKLCLGTDGRVSRIEPIIPVPGASRELMQTLAGWRFEPLSVPICFVQTLEFRVNW